MKIVKGGITRNIDPKRWFEYKDKGYMAADEEAQDDFSLEGEEQDDDFIPEEKAEKEQDEGFFAENKNPETAETEPETDEDFEKMTVSELKAYAEDNDIDLGEATKKADILRVITGRVW